MTVQRKSRLHGYSSHLFDSNKLVAVHMRTAQLRYSVFKESYGSLFQILMTILPLDCPEGISTSPEGIYSLRYSLLTDTE